MSDKVKERERYDARASKILEAKKYDLSSSLYPYMMEPLESYIAFLKNIPSGSKVLEIGGGMGENTEILLKLDHYVTSSDISSKSVEVMKNKFVKYKTFKAEIADIESLPYKNNSFDVVCNAGSLSYGDNLKVMNEIHRVLVNGGCFIAMDSLNNNPIYKLNRFMHYLKGNRSKSTLSRIPNLKLIKNYKKKFGLIEVNYFGSLTWLFPILKIFMSSNNLKLFSRKVDSIFNIKRSGFKFTMKAKKL